MYTYTIELLNQLSSFFKGNEQHRSDFSLSHIVDRETIDASYYIY